MMQAGPDIFSEIVRLREKRVPFSMATIIHVSGSAPRGVGTRMLVTANGRVIGSIGGGVLEKAVKEFCIDSLASGKSMLKDFGLEGTGEAMACGGKVKVFIEPVLPESRLFILGSGHVAHALGSLASFCNLYTLVLDRKEAFCDISAFPWAKEIIKVNDFRHAFLDKKPEANDFIIIATGSHSDDLASVKAALDTKACFIGLLGSKRKWEGFSKKLSGQGVSRKELSRVFCPVGLSIGAQGPEEIAVSIISQIISKIRKKA